MSSRSDGGTRLRLRQRPGPRYGWLTSVLVIGANRAQRWSPCRGEVSLSRAYLRPGVERSHSFIAWEVPGHHDESRCVDPKSCYTHRSTVAGESTGNCQGCLAPGRDEIVPGYRVQGEIVLGYRVRGEIVPVGVRS